MNSIDIKHSVDRFPSAILISLLFTAAIFTIYQNSPASAKPTKTVANMSGQKYFGDCDASTAIAINKDTFFVIGDENSIVRVYKNSAEKVAEADLESCLHIPKKAKTDDEREADLEASARIGDTVYVVSSMGRDDHGVYFKARHQLTAFTYNYAPNKLSIHPVGDAYTHLLKYLIRDPRYEQYRLEDRSIGDDEKMAPKRGGSINVEGLASSKDGTGLVLGLRAPVTEGKALIIPLHNPKQLIGGTDEKPLFGAPIELDLDGLGIRSIEYWKSNDTYLIVAGHVGPTPGYRVYKWTGEKDDSPELIDDKSNARCATPEAIVIYPGVKDKFQILTDNGGTLNSKRKKCKKWDPSKRYFEGFWVTFK